LKATRPAQHEALAHAGLLAQDKLSPAPHVQTTGSIAIGIINAE
jgi:hypothetical protein